MGLWDKIKNNAAQAKDEIEQKVNKKLDEEVFDPTLREHKGEPLKKPGAK